MSRQTRAELTRDVLLAVPRLSDADLQKLAEYVDTLTPAQTATASSGRHPLMGYLKHLGGAPITEDDIAEMRKEMWAKFDHATPDPSRESA